MGYLRGYSESLSVSVEYRGGKGYPPSGSSVVLGLCCLILSKLSSNTGKLKSTLYFFPLRVRPMSSKSLSNSYDITIFTYSSETRSIVPFSYSSILRDKFRDLRYLP